MKNGKATGEDEICVEFLKIGIDDHDLLEIILKIYNDILITENVPTSWTKSVITLVHKKGDITKIQNYRPISIVTQLYKLFMRMLLMKIENILDSKLSPSQAGYRHGYSTIDHLFVMQQLIEKSNEFQSQVAFGFIDYEKAFDSIEHPYLWIALKNDGVPSKYIKIIKKIYENSKTCIKINNQLSRPIKIERGIKQGCPVSPKCYTATHEMIMNSLTEPKGIQVKNNTKLTQLSFADDAVLIENSIEDLMVSIKELSQQAAKTGLKINFEKTKIMTNIDVSYLAHVSVNNNNIELVNEFKYLGQLLSFENPTRKDMQIRINNAWRSFWSLKKFFRSRMAMKQKKKLFDTCVLPVFTYGCQCWAYNESEIEKFRIQQRKMERIMTFVRLSDHQTNKSIRKKTKLVDVADQIEKLKWNWAGHFARHNEEDKRWPNMIEEWNPKGKRKVGRQPTRWIDKIKNVASYIWKKKAMNREKWKELSQAFILSKN